MKIIPSVKGTRDYYPAEMAVRNFLYSAARLVSESFGYQEWDGPFLETIDLYAAKSGEELVKEQSFVFPDRGGDLIALRPELTPSLARLVAQRQGQLVFPLRWWSWGPFWRYERPQKGRTREFFQWNIDLIGVDSRQADAEMLAIAAGFLKSVGLAPAQVSILVNSRALIESELAGLDIPAENRPSVFRLIDRRDKLSPASWQAYAEEIGLSEAQFTGVQRLLSADQLWQKSPELAEVFELAGALGVREYLQYAPQIIRGLDYYTGLVFETWDRDGEFRAMLGGGRYDNLVADVGGDPLPAVGFAMGDLVMTLVLKKFGCLPPELGSSPAKVLVTVFDAGSAPAAMQLAARLRQAGIPAAVYPEAAKLGKQFKYGDRLGMRAAVVLGPDELSENRAMLKDLRSGEQRSLPQAELAKALSEMLAM
ncbi:MAG: histidine--tRNA ligase [Chloroflexi bacterium]|nr:histidine--tRNA ligase [Chloroflexota bacterium]